MDREVKNGKFLKFIIIQRLSTGILELILSLGVLSFLNRDIEKVAAGIAMYLNLDMENKYIQQLIGKAAMVKNGTILGVSGSLLLLGALAVTEGYGLHLRRRWAEWLTVISTSAFIPFEIYEIVKGVSAVEIAILILNLAIVYYLGKHKELFSRRKTHLPLKF